jgi:G3E family GTPase
MNESRVPVTIITGFLVAVETTLLTQLIKDHLDKRFAIIENEFGEIGID